MTAIVNKKQLIRNGGTQADKEARSIALNALESALNAADPKQIVRSRLSLRHSTVNLNNHSFDLAKFKNVYVVGAGKGSGSMAEALEEILGSYITSGLVNVPYGSRQKTKTVKLHEANHPVPDEAGVKGSRKIMEIAVRAEDDDLVICLISGGGSSLMPLPRKGISIADKRKVTQALLKSGATIEEFNTVRKHISDIKGGWLARRAYPATLLNLILSDVVGDDLSFIASGPTVPDLTTFHDSIKVLKKYRLWAEAPTSVRKVLMDGEKRIIPETPKADDEAFKKVYNVVIGNNRTASVAACKYLASRGLNTLLLTTTLEGEARHVGVALSSMAREVSLSGNPVRRPAGTVVGGETTVTVKGKGLGGRNQELSLSGAVKLSGVNGGVLASVSTDGIDGPTDAAGAIVDGKTLTKAKGKGLAPEESLAQNDSYSFFSKLNDLIFTGPTGTNVNDIVVIVVR